jgi:hypothetical protein
MENTGKVLFEDETPHWYIAMGERWVGPLSAGDVYQRVVSGELTWAHFVWKAGQADWRRLCDVKTFQVALPSQAKLPTKNLQNEVKEASRPAIRKAGAKGATPPPPSAPRRENAVERIWFLHYNDAQYGPFSSEEISRFLRVGKLHGRVHIWRDGMSDWARLEEVAQFDDAASAKAREQRKGNAAETPPAKTQAKPGKTSGTGTGTGTGSARIKPATARNGATSGSKESQIETRENRGTPRRPLVAKILMANQDSVIVAICRDISVGGMQVLTDRIPGVPGARIKLNVSQGGDAKVDSKNVAIEPFVAEGVIVRILEDGRGFSFRFDRLPDPSRKTIEKYIEGGSA